MIERAAYPSDIADEEWSYLDPLLPAPKFGTPRGGRPQEFPTREIVNGIRYVLRTGCAWRLMPHDRPPWWTVYHYMVTHRPATSSPARPASATRVGGGRDGKEHDVG